VRNLEKLEFTLFCGLPALSKIMKLATAKQVNYLVYMIKGYMPELIDKMPKNNKAHPDIRANYQRAILEDIIRSYTTRDINYIVSQLLEGNKQNVEQYILGITV